MDYCWVSDKRSNARGPFATVEEARRDALEAHLPDEQPVVIDVHEVRYVRPGDWICDDATEMLERMDDAVCGECMFDDPIFCVPREEAAQKALTEAIAKWVDEFVEVEGRPFMTGKLVFSTSYEEGDGDD